MRFQGLTKEELLDVTLGYQSLASGFERALDVAVARATVAEKRVERLTQTVSAVGEALRKASDAAAHAEQRAAVSIERLEQAEAELQDAEVTLTNERRKRLEVIKDLEHTSAKYNELFATAKAVVDARENAMQRRGSIVAYGEQLNQLTALVNRGNHDVRQVNRDTPGTNTQDAERAA